MIQLIPKHWLEVVEHHAERTAIIHPIGKLSYAELHKQASQLANQLAEAGVAQGSPVAVVTDDRLAHVAALLGTLLAGCAYVPLDLRNPTPRLRRMLAEVAPECYVTTSNISNGLHELVGSPVPAERMLLIDKLADSRNERYAERPVIQHDANDLCYVYFTSGSTGVPKGIAGRLLSLTHFIDWELRTFGVDPQWRVSQLTPPSFDPYLRDVLVPLCAGASICIPPAQAGDTAALVAWLDQSEVQLVHCVPSLFRALLNEPLLPTMFAALRYVALAGEHLLPADVRRWHAVFGDRVQLVNLYGPTETTLAKFYYFVQPADAERRVIPIGRPIEGAAAIVVDEHGHPAAPGAIGEIYIRTPFRSHGYYRRPELTHEQFIQNPFSKAANDIVYKTGDLGRRLADGTFELFGRRDQQMKVRGVRIELAEIESVLRAHPAVSDVAIVDRHTADGEVYLCAYIAPASSIDLADLRQFVAQALPDGMVPSAFVVIDVLPRTLSGKIDRRALPTPEQARPPYIAPRTAAELQVARVWERVLGIARIGVHDHFFNLGGHSLATVRVVTYLEQELGRQLPLAALLHHPTVEALAQALGTAENEAGALLVPLSANQGGPAMFWMHPLGGTVLCYAELVQALVNGPALYGLQARGLDGEPPHQTIEAMAQDYVAAITARQPSGPYLLAGWSMGGAVAFEVGRQLLAAGAEVGPIICIDSEAPLGGEPDNRDDTALLRDLLGDDLPLDQTQLAHLHSDALLSYVVQQAAQAARIPPGFGLPQARALLNVYRANLHAAARYRPSPAELHVVLLRARDEQHSAELKLSLGWERLAGTVDVHNVPGTHDSVLRAPQIQELAQHLGPYVAMHTAATQP